MNKFIAGGWGKVPEEILALYPKINVTGLKDFNTSPAYFESRAILKEMEATKAMDLGTKLHYAILEPEKFEEMFMVEPTQEEIPDWVCDTNAELQDWCASEGLKKTGSKAELVSRLRDHGLTVETYEEWILNHAKGRQLLKQKEAHAAKRIIERIKSIESTANILKNGEVEKLGWVLHYETKTVVSFRIDYFKPLEKKIAGYEQFAIDLKTTNSLSTNRDLQKFIANDDTHIQGAFYVDALEYLTKLPTAFAIFAVETTAPYTTMMQIFGGATLEVGRADYEKNIRTFRECFDNKKYPTGFEKIGTIELPNWKLAEIENREGEILNNMAQ